jgi:hypothetical protein
VFLPFVDDIGRWALVNGRSAQLIATPARLAHSAHQQVLHLPRGWRPQIRTVSSLNPAVPAIGRPSRVVHATAATLPVWPVRG